MPEQQIKFDEQEYLNSYIDEIMDDLERDTSFQYNHIYKLDTSEDSFPVSLAKLIGKSESVSLNRLSTHQMSSLVPKIRLFRLQGNEGNQKEYEFLFKKDTRYNYNPAARIEHTLRGENCGIVSVEYKIAGTNPVTAEKAIEVIIEFYFDSINSFSGGDYDEMLKFWKNNQSFDTENDFDDPVSKTTTNYWSLIMHPQYKKQNQKYEPKDFRIKAIVGWEQLKPFLTNELFDNLEEINNDLQDTSLSMFLQLTMHNFTFNEDGSLRLRVEYIGTIENIFNNKKFDIFDGLVEEIRKSTDVAQLLTDKEQIEAKIKLLNYFKQKKSFSDLKDEAEKCGNAEVSNLLENIISKFSTVSDTGSSIGSIQQTLEELDKQRQENEKKRKETIFEIKKKYYSQLSNTLLNTAKIKSITVSESDVTSWLNYRNNNSDIPITKPSFTSTPITLVGPERDKAIAEANEKLENERERASEGEEEPLAGAPSSESGAPSPSTTIEPSLDSIPAMADDDHTAKTINYTTIGSIIDAVYSYEKFQELEEWKLNRVIFSTFDSGGSLSRNIADIPVSLERLTNFLLENIEHQQKQNYTLREMLRDVMTQLVETCLNSPTLKETKENLYANTSVAFTSITLKGESASQPLNSIRKTDSGLNVVSTFSKKREDLKRFYPNSSLNTNEKYYNYFLIYDKYLKDFDGVGNRIEDEKRGIYHLSIAQNIGLLKEVTFKRVDQPGQREAKSLGKDTIFLGQFRDFYHADVVLFGNNIFHPGMLVFIKPSVELGNPANEDSFSQISGIGGYYTVISVNSVINQGQYLTTLNCFFHSAGIKRSDKENKKTTTNSCSELERAGLLSADGKVGTNNKELTQLINLLESQFPKRVAEAVVNAASRDPITGTRN